MSISTATAARAATPFTSAEQRAVFLSTFVAKAHARELTSTDMALRALVLGKPLAKAFTPITNPIKLANGQRPYGSLEAALRRLRFDLTRDQIEHPLLEKVPADAVLTLVREALSAKRG